MSSKKSFKYSVETAIALVMGILFLLPASVPQPRGAARRRTEETRPAASRKPSEKRAVSSVAVNIGGASGKARGSSAESEAATPATVALVSLICRIVDQSTGGILADETVLVGLRGPDSSRSETVKTDPWGRFELRGVPAGVYSLQTRHVEYIPDIRRVDVEEPGVSPPPEVVIALVPGESLEGKVVDTKGLPVAQAHVKMMLLGGDVLENAGGTTAEDGSFLLRGLRSGLWELSAFREGFRRRSVQVEVPADGNLRLELSEDPGFDVSVVGPGGAPVVGAHVTVLLRTQGMTGSRESGVTDGKGRLHLRGLPEDPEGRLALDIRHPEFIRERKILTGRELSTGPVSILLSRGSAVSAEEVEGADERRDGTGAPSGSILGFVSSEAGSQGFEILLSRESGASEPPRQRRFRFGSQSLWFRLRNIAPGSYSMSLLVQGETRFTVKGIEVLSGHETGPVELEIPSKTEGAGDQP